MNRMLAGSFLAATFAVGLSAQTTPPQTTPPSQPPMQESRDSAAKTVTVVGCLKAGDAPDSFQLTDLKFSKDAKGSGAVGTSGSAAPPAAIANATTIKVIPSGSTKLSEHVGHTVEVTGTVGDKMDRPSSAAPSDPAAARPPASASAAGPSLEVRTVKMVSATCTPQ